MIKTVTVMQNCRTREFKSVFSRGVYYLLVGEWSLLLIDVTNAKSSAKPLVTVSTLRIPLLNIDFFFPYLFAGNLIGYFRSLPVAIRARGINLREFATLALVNGVLR